MARKRYDPTAALLLLGLLGIGSPLLAVESSGAVKGIIRVDGDVPTPEEWRLEAAMERLTGEKTYRAETWLVGENEGLANCVVTLSRTDSALQPGANALESTAFDKVGVRYVPRVLVVTPGTKVTLRNQVSPCKGFHFHGRRAENCFSHLIEPGTEKEITFYGPDTCSVTCPVRPYAQGYVRVVSTPHFAVTDVNGEFTIQGLPEGEYKVTIWHEAAGTFPKDAGPSVVDVSSTNADPLTYRIKPQAENAD